MSQMHPPHPPHPPQHHLHPPPPQEPPRVMSLRTQSTDIFTQLCSLPRTTMSQDVSNVLRGGRGGQEREGEGGGRAVCQRFCGLTLKAGKHSGPSKPSQPLPALRSIRSPPTGPLMISSHPPPPPPPKPSLLSVFATAFSSP